MGKIFCKFYEEEFVGHSFLMNSIFFVFYFSYVNDILQAILFCRRYLLVIFLLQKKFCAGHFFLQKIFCWTICSYGEEFVGHSFLMNTIFFGLFFSYVEDICWSFFCCRRSFVQANFCWPFFSAEKVFLFDNLLLWGKYFASFMKKNLLVILFL